MHALRLLPLLAALITANAINNGVGQTPAMVRRRHTDAPPSIVYFLLYHSLRALIPCETPRNRTIQHILTLSPSNLLQGWSSWNTFRCDINDTLVREIADAMVSSGLRDAGYKYVNIDDCWMEKRSPEGAPTPSPPSLRRQSPFLPHSPPFHTPTPHPTPQTKTRKHQGSSSRSPGNSRT